MDKKILDAHGNDVTHAGDPKWVPVSRHNKMLGELATAMSLLETTCQALQSAKAFIAQMDKAGLIDDPKGEMKTYQTKTDALLVGAKEFMSRYVIKEEPKKEDE